jgi:site-specific DNA-methyltransferase (adenine-specific)
MSNRQIKVSYLTLDKLRLWKGNPKRHDIPSLQVSLSRFGFVAPVILDEKSNRVIAGHGRIEALQIMRTAGKPAPAGVRITARGQWSIPVVRGVSFATEQEASAYLLADNKLTENGGWDSALLADMLSPLSEELGGMGWDPEEVEALLERVEKDTKRDEEDREGKEKEQELEPPGDALTPSKRPLFGMEQVKLHLGDCLEVLQKLPSASVDALVTDPPAGIGYMGKSWDSAKGGHETWIGWLQAVLTEAKRVLKPGAHALVWAFPRTSHWTASALEGAGFEIRDVLLHLVSPPAPKSVYLAGEAARKGLLGGEELEGLGTGVLKSAEHWILARVPFKQSTVENVLKHGTGALDIAGCKVVRDGGERETWPRTVTWEHSSKCTAAKCSPHCVSQDFFQANQDQAAFFYCAPASKAEREAGCEGLESKTYQTITGRKGKKHARTGGRFALTGAVRNLHPTVKPIALMRWLVRLVSRPGFVVLDPFLGSGTTGIAALLEGCGVVGIEQDPEFLKVAEHRMKFWSELEGEFLDYGVEDSESVLDSEEFED